MSDRIEDGKIRFNTIFVSDKISSDAKIVDLKEWSEKFQKNGLTPKVEGNYTGNLTVFHGHNALIVKYAEKLKLPVTRKECESGTIELAKEVLKVLGDKKLIVLRNHGFISIGTTIREAGAQALAILTQSKVANLSRQ